MYADAAWPRVWDSLAETAAHRTMLRAAELSSRGPLDGRRAAFLAMANDADPATLARALVAGGLTVPAAADATPDVAQLAWEAERRAWYHADGRIGAAREPWAAALSAGALMVWVLDVGAPAS